MNLKLKKLSIATAAVLSTGMIGQSQANDLLFPYVVESQAVTTIITTMNTGSGNANNQLHYRLWYKNGAAASDNSATCAEVNVLRPTSQNDIQTINLGGVLDNELGVMFNDPSINNNWQAAGGNFDLAAGLTSPVRGYMVVDDQTPGGAAKTPGDTGALAGEAFIFEFQSGAAWGYQAENQTSPDFTTAAMVYGGSSPVSVMPWDSATTRFFVTPLVANMRNGNNGSTTTLTMGATGSTAMWDRDENPVSGNVTGTVNCVGAIDAADMISEGARLQLPDGGWGVLNYSNANGNTVATTATDADGNVISNSASVLKLEFNDGTSSFAGASSNVFNNAFQLQ